jgi:hypothetical protein
MFESWDLIKERTATSPSRIEKLRAVGPPILKLLEAMAPCDTSAMHRQHHIKHKKQYTTTGRRESTIYPQPAKIRGLPELQENYRFKFIVLEMNQSSKILNEKKRKYLFGTVFNCKKAKALNFLYLRHARYCKRLRKIVR